MKMNQLKKKMIPLAMAMALVATGFAGNLAVQKTAYAEETPKTLIIKKVLTMPSEGVATPAETFEFKFEAQSFNGKTDSVDTTCPNIANATATYATTDIQDADGAKEGKQVIKSTNDILNGITWTKAGQYVYTVTEKQASTDGMEYSKASYTLSIIVASEGGSLKVKYVGIKKDKEDNGNINRSATKTEYTPDDPSGSGNNFVFENKYFPKKGNDTPDTGEVTQEDKNGLAISKKVAGENTSNTQPFKFTMKIDKPEGLADGQTYTYIVTTKGGTKLPATETTAQYGQDQEITLTHGDKVVLKSVHMGAKASVTEIDAAGYTPSVIVNCNGTSVPKTETNKAENIILGDKTSGNSIEFTNTQQTPTGVIIDNLPFIILVAIAGMGIFFFVRNKRRAEEF